ncbi:WAGO-3 protein [Aphelenchoides avenae]|nr:WAGO-3 protein [Aphelenchus avenae]
MTQLEADLRRLNVNDPQGTPNFVRTAQGKANLFKIFVEPGRKAYRYNVDVRAIQHDRSLIKGADDGQKSTSQRVCRDLLTFAYLKTDKFGWNEDIPYLYDFSSALYTTKPIQISRSIVEIRKDTDFAGFPVATQELLPNSDIHVAITASETQHELDLNDLSQYTDGTSLWNEDNSLRRFFEAVVSQQALDSELYTSLSAGDLYVNGAEHRTPIRNGMEMRPGVSRGVKVVRNHGETAATVVLDATYSAFFKPEKLEDTVFEIAPQLRNEAGTADTWRGVEEMLKGIRVYSERKKNRTFRIVRFTEEKINQTWFIDPLGNEMNVHEHFKQIFVRLNRDIPRDYFPGIEVDHVINGRNACYAIEDLRIATDQRVPQGKIKSIDGLQKTVLNKNTVAPEIRMRRIMFHAEDMGIFDASNRYLRTFGIRVEKDSNKIDIGIRGLPDLHMKNATFSPKPEDASFREALKNRYLETHKVKKWAVLMNFNEKGKNDVTVKKFIAMVQSKQTQKEMQLGAPTTFKYLVDPTRTNTRKKIDDVWKETFAKFKEDGFEFALYFDSLKDKRSHGKNTTLKFCEAYYKVLTQHVPLETAEGVVYDRNFVTLDNILFKTNCKNFGLNYETVTKDTGKYTLESGEILVIGYDVAHPPALQPAERRLLQSTMQKKGQAGSKPVVNTEPSVVGFAANVGRHPHQVVGDYFYQQARKEAVDEHQLKDIMEWALEQRAKNRPHQGDPSTIIVLRDGVSESQFQMIEDTEVPALREGCHEYRHDYNPKIVFGICTKRHNKRPMELKGGKLVNMPPGSVVDGSLHSPGTLGIERADCPEFYMLAHSAIRPNQSTAKPMQFAYPINEAKMTADELQSLLLSLCFEHQICAGAVSQPEPTFQAHELAKRGMSNFHEMKRMVPNEILRVNGIVDTQALTERLRYRGSILESTRFTA